MSSISKNKSLKAALALGGGLVTVGLMAAMMNDDDGPPEDVVAVSYTHLTLPPICSV